MREIMKAVEVAEIFRVDTRTVSSWCRRGKLPGAFTTLGGHWRIPAQAVQEMWVSQMEDTTNNLLDNLDVTG